ncbi:phosphoadenylyl-sulfate reductase [Roseateles sp. UC29_93]|uniref:phosphoadenylyl-sulfate reductase n=1 Tax=Roseateles sp. UC29_93 TaxID=3350177 RepID=UPI00366FC772
MSGELSSLDFAPIGGVSGTPSNGVSALPGAADAGVGSAIGLYARKTAGFDERVARTVEVLKQAAADFGPGTLQSTSLGVEDMVITDLIARHGLPIALATLDTGKLHEQTLALIPRIHERYGIAVEVFAPVNEQVVHFVRANGEEPMYRSVDLRKACCGVRKLEPLSRMLAGRSAWITGLRREQSANRAEVPFRETETTGDGQVRTKINPLAEWTWADVWYYVQQHVVPYNPLHDQFMPSIGCAPCTRAIAVGEDFRAGRWWWEDSAKECGLHATHAEPDTASEPEASPPTLNATSGAPA